MLEAIIGLAVLIGSVVVHETAHGLAAAALGDDTARKAGRLTLNPVKHLDPVGSVILPAMMFFLRGPMFGYAKPVPVNPAKLHGRDRWGFALVALAGPASNLVMAFVAAVVLARMFGIELASALINIRGTLEFAGVTRFVLLAVFSWNMLLAAFNLIPIPPLDGSRLLRIVLSADGRRTLDRIEPYGFLILFAIFVWLGDPLFRAVQLISSGLMRILPL